MNLSENVNLIVYNSEGLSWRDKENCFDHTNWTINFQYKEPWLGSTHNSAIYLNASQAAKGIDGNYQELQINRDATIEQVIAAARHLFPGFNNDYEQFCGIPLSYQLYYPAFGDQSLSLSSRLSDLRVTNGEVFVLKQIIGSAKPKPKTTKDFTNFTDMVAMNGKLKDNRNAAYDNPALHAVLLYSEEDIKLATYVRAYFDQLQKMSGLNLMFKVVEEQLKRSPYSNLTFWKIRLKHTAYLAWSILGWVRSKPFKKFKAIEIAQKLGVFPDQLPCVVLFDSIHRQEKIIVPVQDNYYSFFTKLFSTLNLCMSGRKNFIPPTNGSANLFNSFSMPNGELKQQKGRLFEIIHKMERKNGVHESGEHTSAADLLKQADSKLFDSIRKALENTRSKEKPLRTVFEINGQTVYLNHPDGFKNKTRETIIHRLKQPGTEKAEIDVQKINSELMRLVELVFAIKELPVGAKEQAVMTLHFVADQVGNHNGNGKLKSNKASTKDQRIELKAA